jgi:hypothetical protein
MPRCTLHIGGPKTGSTAIQDALFFHLRDPGFQYVSGGEPNGSLAFEALCFESPQSQRIFHRFGSPRGSFAAYRSALERQWNRGVDRAVAQGTHLIISAENLWASPEPALRRLRDFLESRGFEIRVQGYLRPWKSWVTSLWAHKTVHDRGRFELLSPRDQRVFQVDENVERLRAVFGQDRVQLSLFDPARFPEGCVVRHFASQIGLRVPPGFHLRANDGSSRPAVQLAYCYNRFENPVQEEDFGYPPGKFRMLGLVRQLPGPRLRLHPELVEPWWEHQRKLNPWIEREFGFSMEDPPAASPIEGAIRCEADLFEFDSETLAWLARESGQPVIRQQSGEEAARQVARQVSLLRFRWLSAREIRNGLLLRLRKAWVRARWGC